MDIVQKVSSNLVWRLLERFGSQIISFIVSIILARLLDTEVYGTIALVTVFTNIMYVFVDSGMGNALIQKKDADNADFSTVFFFNIAMCIILYLGLFVAAPFIADFYDNTDLTAVIRVLSLTLIISGVKNVQQAYVSKNMLFKRFFFATLGGMIVSAIIGITMAYRGFGVWALVAQYLSSAAMDTIILWFTVKWRPNYCFDPKRLKSLFSFGSRMLVSSLIDTVYLDIRQLIIGKMYTPSDLAYYNKGEQFPKLIISNINSSISSVLFPTIAQAQGDTSVVKSMTRRAIKMSTYIMAPLMIGLAATGDIVIELLLTEKWLPCVPYLVIFCITNMFYPINSANLNALKAMGRSDWFLRLEVIKKAVGMSVLLVTMWHGPLVMCASGIITSVISQIINAWPNKKLLNYSILEQWQDIAPSILLASAMGVSVWFLGGMLDLSPILKLIAQVMFGGVFYVAGSLVFKLEPFQYALNVLKRFINKQ